MNERRDDQELLLQNVGAEHVSEAPTNQNAVLSPADEIDMTLKSMGQTVTAALTPLGALIWNWETIEEYVKTTVERILRERQVPSERIQTPSPDVAVPALEAIRYSKLREQYAMLLATSMDKEAASFAHPAFVEILKQLTPDEARILRFLPKKGLAEPILDVVYDVPQRGRFTHLRNASMLYEDAKCEHPELTPKYIDNLCRLGLTSAPEGRGLFDDWRYDRIRKSSAVRLALESLPENSQSSFEYRSIGLTDMGEGFRMACLSISGLDSEPLWTVKRNVTLLK
jgi:hypothetical protein